MEVILRLRYVGLFSALHISNIYSENYHNTPIALRNMDYQPKTRECQTVKTTVTLVHESDFQILTVLSFSKAPDARMLSFG
jgi:hypothetical protein